MKSIFFTAIVLVTFFTLGFKERESVSEKLYTTRELLTNGNSKTWNITSNSPQNTLSTCNFPNSYSGDNIWTFFDADTFTFNPGSITGRGDTLLGCTDPMPFSGRWELSSDESRLELYISKINGDTIAEELFQDAQIISLSDQEMILRILDNNILTDFTFASQ